MSAFIIATALTPLSAAEEPLRLNLNDASRVELEALPAIGSKRAQWIIDTRERNGGFRCVEELRAMPRLSERVFERLEKLVYVDGPEVRDCRPQEAVGARERSASR